MSVGRGKFSDVQREVDHGLKHFIAAHDLIHVFSLHNSDHTRYGPDADLFIEQPHPFSGDFVEPDDDKLVLLNSAQTQVASPPIFLKKAIADIIRDSWKS